MTAITAPVTALRSAESAMIQQIHATTEAVNQIASGLPGALADLSSAVMNAKVRLVIAQQDYLAQLSDLAAFVNGIADGMLIDLNGPVEMIPAPTVQSVTTQELPAPTIQEPQEATQAVPEHESATEPVLTVTVSHEPTESEESASEQVVTQAANPAGKLAPSPVLTPADLEGYPAIITEVGEVQVDAAQLAPKKKGGGRRKR